MAEPRPRPRGRLAHCRERRERRNPGEGAERQHDAHAIERDQLADEVRRAIAALRREGLVVRRRALHGGRHPAPDRPQPVVGSDARRLAGQAGAMECCPQEVAARVAGEDAAGPVAAVRRRRQPEDEDPGVVIAEAGERPRPVGLVGEPPRCFARGSLAPLDQAGTADTNDDLALERLQDLAAIRCRDGPT
jgi:hypothetical protein